MRFLITFAGMLVVAGVAVPAGAAQAPPPLDRTVTLALDRVSLKEALDEVARQTGVRIAYSRRVVPLDRPVSVQLAAVRVGAALDTLLYGTGVASRVDRTGQILLITDSDGSSRPSRQTGSIAGSVKDGDTGGPITAATVTVVGTRFSAQTDAEGRFTIGGVPAGSYRLRARMLGYTAADTSAVVEDGQQSVTDLRLKRSPIELNPVVAIGYATVEKRDLTGAVSSVSGDQFETKAAPTVTLSGGLQGKIAGVQVTSNSGMPGVGIRVRVRGTGSISANSEPLYVIDGLPAEQGAGGDNDDARDPKTNPLMSLDPNEIESIDVLKDASATAIYGSRGANGVVLITTKRGRVGETRVRVESNAGFQSIRKTIPVLNGPQFMQLANEAVFNAEGDSANLPFTAAQIGSAATYNYPAMMLRTGLQTNQAISLSGGEQKLRYLLSGNFTRQEGIVLGSDFNRYGVRLNLDGDASSRFRWGSSLSLTRVARNAARVENGAVGNSANGLQAAMQFAPFAAPKDAAGNWIMQSPSTEPVPNPVANALEETDLNTTSRALGSVFAELDITPELKVRSTFGGNFQFDGIHFYAPRTILDGGSGGSGWMYNRERRNLTNENTVSYRRAAGPGKLDLLGGYSVQTWYEESARANGADFPIDHTNVYDLGSGSTLVAPVSTTQEHALLSFLGRANYNVADKYLFTLTGRRDGSSVFGANHKWGFFPSGAFAWRLGDESFMRQQSLFSDLKLRISYGKVGSQAVDPYQALAQLNVAWYSSGATEIPAMAPGSLMPNPDLHWEEQTQFDAGLDAALLHNRVTFTFDAYHSKTRDLLLLVNVPITTGFNQQLQNVGSVQNNGVELSVTTTNIERPKLTWRSTLTISHNHNKVLDLGTRPDPVTGKPVAVTEFTVTPRTGNFFDPGDVYLVRVGEPLGSIYGYQVAGLWQVGDQCYLKNALDCTPGEFKIADLNGDSAITGADRTILGYGEPKFLSTVHARRVLQLHVRQQDYQRREGVRLPRHHAGQRADLRARSLDADPHQHRCPAPESGSGAAPLQHVRGGRLLPAAPDAHAWLRAAGGAHSWDRRDPALRHGSEPVHDHWLLGVRSGRQQRGRGRALRPDRHRRLPASAGMELRPDHHILSREDTAMRYQRFVAPLVLAVGLSVIACTDLLNEDPKGFATTDTFFKTGADLNSATLAIYNALRGLQGQSNWTTPELASDQARADNREPNSGTYGPDRLNWSAATGRANVPFGTIYGIVSRANLVLAKGPGIAAPDAVTQAYNLAEAKFLRGYAYLRLTKAYDGVPLLLTPADQANPSPTRAPLDAVHQAVIQDLTEAYTGLPRVWPGNDGYGIPTQGRVTKAAAAMALADLYAWRSSFMLKSEWQQASDWAKTVIDSSGAWGLGLNDNYFSTFLPTNKSNQEMIFVINNSGVTDRTSNIFQLFYYPRDWGLDQGQGGGWGLIHPTDWFLNSYLPGDFRGSRGHDGYKSDSGFVAGGCGLTLCADPLGDGPMPWKYRKSDGGDTWWLGDVDVPLYRYAEAILIYAEAQNELNNAAVAVQHLNMIRARARKGTGAQTRTEPHDYGTAGEPMDQVSVREAIYMERAWEFAFEAKRWFDLVRRDSEEPNYWATQLHLHDPNSEKLGATSGQTYKKRWPIPQTQITANPALCQNPGYGGTACPPGVTFP